MSLLLRSSIVASALFLALPSQVAAQRVAGPFAGVLGGNQEGRQSLDFRSSVFGAADDILSRTDEEGVDDRFFGDGASVGGSLSLSHSLRTEGMQWESSADSSLRIFGTGESESAMTFSGHSSVSTALSTRVSLAISGGINFSPFYQLSPQIGDPLSSVNNPVDPFALATAAERNIGYNASTSSVIRTSRRDSVDVGVSGSYYDFLDQTSASTSSWEAHARYQRTLRRNLSAYAGFARVEANYESVADDPDASSNSIDAGVSYGDTLTFSRQTALSFSASTGATNWGGDTNYRVNGNLSLTRTVGRTGSVAVSYARDTSFTPGFLAPLLSDTVSASVGAQIGRNASWSANAGLIRGDVGFGDNAYGTYRSHSAGVNVNRALMRRMSVYGGYTYYHYEAPSGSTVFTFDSKFSRQSIFGGLSFWVPLMNERASR